MPMMHAAWSIGAAVGSGISAACAALGITPSAQLIAEAVLIAAAALGTAAGIRRKAPVDRRTESRPRLRGWLDWRLLLRRRHLATRRSSTRLTLAVRNDHGQTAAVAALYFTAFAAGEGLTRIFGGPIVDRLGRVRTIRTTTALGVVGMVLFIQAVNPWIVLMGVLLWAVGVSMGFPLGMSAAAESGPDPAARVSVVASIGYFANLAGPPLIGALAQSVGLLNALWLIVALFLAAFAAASSSAGGGRPRTGRRPRRRSVRNLPPELRRRDDGRARMHPDAHGGKPSAGTPPGRRRQSSRTATNILDPGGAMLW